MTPGFAAHLRERDRSENTITGYLRDLDLLDGPSY